MAMDGRRSPMKPIVIVLAALCVWLWMLASKAAKSKVETPPAKPAA